MRLLFPTSKTLAGSSRHRTSSHFRMPRPNSWRAPGKPCSSGFQLQPANPQTYRAAVEHGQALLELAQVEERLGPRVERDQVVGLFGQHLNRVPQRLLKKSNYFAILNG